MPLLAPNVNSYRRLMPDYDAPINTHWGYDNRTVGLRVPNPDSHSRRVENRLARADANPHLALPASMDCGPHGMKEHTYPHHPNAGNTHRTEHTIPSHLHRPHQDSPRSTPLTHNTKIG